MSSETTTGLTNTSAQKLLFSLKRRKTGITIFKKKITKSYRISFLLPNHFNKYILSRFFHIATKVSTSIRNQYSVLLGVCLPCNKKFLNMISTLIRTVSVAVLETRNCFQHESTPTQHILWIGCIMSTAHPVFGNGDSCCCKIYWQCWRAYCR